MEPTTIKERFELFDELKTELDNLCESYTETKCIDLGYNYDKFILSTDGIIILKNNDLTGVTSQIFVSFDEIEKFMKDYNLMSKVILDINTGYYLLNGNKRTQETNDLHNEFAQAIKAIQEENVELTDRQKYLIRLASLMFYDGLSDMCETFELDFNKTLIKI